MKRTIATLLIFCLAGLCAGAPARAQDAVATDGTLAFETPETVIAHFLEAIAAQNLGAALQTSYALTYGEAFDFDAYTLHVKGIQPAVHAPGNAAVYRRINAIKLLASFCTEILYVYYSLYDGEISQSIPIDSQEALEAYLAQVDPGQFADLTLLRVDVPSPSRLADETARENYAAQAAIFGADERTERVALVTLQGERYVCGFT
ncbi:hypothetical protein LJC74_03005, partial [Eubacteriales bacterium OttesenSCG-928-A19]|nr:hypothetical protein [Eubacteriales bacterium OttesenSCG-928-A19]